MDMNTIRQMAYRIRIWPALDVAQPHASLTTTSTTPPRRRSIRPHGALDPLALLQFETRCLRISMMIVFTAFKLDVGGIIGSNVRDIDEK
jgi:hypothetical protein